MIETGPLLIWCVVVGVYPLLRKWNIEFGPVLRVFLGFLVEAISMTWACVLQYYIYKNPEKSINVWLQAPAYVFGALGEIWVVVTGLEIAFLKSPPNLRTFVSSIFWVSIAVGALIGIGLSPVSKSPNMVWVYGSLAITSLLSGVLFYVFFQGSIKGTVPVTVGVELVETELTTAMVRLDEEKIKKAGE